MAIYIYISIVLISACPINLFDRILLYILLNLNGAAVANPRPLFMLRYYTCNVQQKNKGIAYIVFFWGGGGGGGGEKLRYGFCFKQC